VLRIGGEFLTGSFSWRGLDIRSALNYSTSLVGGHLLQF
jgi:hypothetical protein